MWVTPRTAGRCERSAVGIEHLRGSSERQITHGMIALGRFAGVARLPSRSQQPRHLPII